MSVIQFNVTDGLAKAFAKSKGNDISDVKHSTAIKGKVRYSDGNGVVKFELQVSDLKAWIYDSCYRIAEAE